MNRYTVLVRRMVVQYQTVEIEALNEALAAGMAENQAARSEPEDWTTLKAPQFDAVKIDLVGQSK